MTRNNQPNELSVLGLVSDAGIRKSIRHLPTVLHPDEKVRCAATGFLEGRSGIVVATSLRFLFVYRDQTPVDVAYSEIRHFRARAGIMAAELLIEDAVGLAVIKQIHPRQRLVELAALLHDPFPAEVPHSERLHARWQEPWRPRLRPKVSPLPVRTPEFPRRGLLSSEVGEVRHAPSSLEVEDSSRSGWKPQFGSSAVDEFASDPTAAAKHSGSLTRMRSGSSIVIGEGWLRAGEWLVAVFAEVLLFESEYDSPRQGVTAVTNRRIVFVESGNRVRDWSFGAITDTAIPLMPNRVGFSGESALDFPDATTAREFGAAARAAGDLPVMPSLRMSEDA